MRYLVMECHLGYAVVLDSDGRFLKVANLNYTVGQKVPYVVEAGSRPQIRMLQRRLAAAVAAAACLCMILFAGRGLMLPYGTVRMQINPDVKLSANYFNYVVKLEGLNKDGQKLIDGYEYRGKKMTEVTAQLADEAWEAGYLTGNGTIYVSVESKHSRWKNRAESSVSQELEQHFANRVRVVKGEKAEESTEKDTENANKTMVTVPALPQPTEVPAPSSGRNETKQSTPTGNGANTDNTTKGSGTGGSGSNAANAGQDGVKGDDEDNTDSGAADYAGGGDKDDDGSDRGGDKEEDDESAGGEDKDDDGSAGGEDREEEDDENDSDNDNGNDEASDDKDDEGVHEDDSDGDGVEDAADGDSAADSAADGADTDDGSADGDDENEEGGSGDEDNDEKEDD